MRATDVPRADMYGRAEDLIRFQLIDQQAGRNNIRNGVQLSNFVEVICSTRSPCASLPHPQ
jgi:hypothetical protein